VIRLTSSVTPAFISAISFKIFGSRLLSASLYTIRVNPLLNIIERLSIDELFTEAAFPPEKALLVKEIVRLFTLLMAVWLPALPLRVMIAVVSPVLTTETVSPAGKLPTV